VGDGDLIFQAMTKVILILTLVFSSSWAQLRPRSHDPGVEPYVEAFLADAGMDRTRYDLLETAQRRQTWDPRWGGGYIGMCTLRDTADRRPNKLEVDPLWWAMADEVQRWELVAHELGHCICGLDHSFPDRQRFTEDLMDEDEGFRPPGFLRDKCPSSIMYPSQPSEECLLTHHGLYMAKIRRACLGGTGILMPFVRK
jgi:hypothetical protein